MWSTVLGAFFAVLLSLPVPLCELGCGQAKLPSDEHEGPHGRWAIFPHQGKGLSATRLKLQVCEVAQILALFVFFLFILSLFFLSYLLPLCFFY